MTSPQSKPVAGESLADIAPKLSELTKQVLFGDVWERPGLSKRDRSLITVSTLVALNRTEQLRVHLKRALENGVTKDELIELITHLAFYSGWPTAMSAVTLAKDVFKQNQ
jgi:4-carboxymuconolactone decarboxylase